MSKRLTTTELFLMGLQAAKIAGSAQGPLHLTPKGVRIGKDRALIFVFEYDPQVFALKARLVNAIQHIRPDFSGRPKPMISITLERPLGNLDVDESLQQRMAAFAEKYIDAAPLLRKRGIETVDIPQVHLCHETRWMHEEKDFELALSFGNRNDSAQVRWLWEMAWRVTGHYLHRGPQVPERPFGQSGFGEPTTSKSIRNKRAA